MTLRSESDCPKYIDYEHFHRSEILDPNSERISFEEI